jgi:hypothetical protein
LSFISQFLKRFFASTILTLLILEQINKFDKPIPTNFALRRCRTFWKNAFENSALLG